MADRVILASAMMIYLLYRRRKRRKQRKIKRTVWVREIFREEQRKKYGQFHTLVKEIRLGDRESYFRLVVKILLKINVALLLMYHTNA